MKMASGKFGETGTHSMGFELASAAFWAVLVLMALVNRCSADTLFVSNFGDNTISKISSSGVVSTFVNTPSAPYGLAFDGYANLYVSIASATNKIIRITPNKVITTSATLPYYSPTDLAFDHLGNLYVASQNGAGVGRLNPSGKLLTPFYTNELNNILGLAIDQQRNLYALVEDPSVNNRIQKITPSRTFNTFCSRVGMWGWGLAFDADGNLYFGAGANVARITPAGVRSTYATGFMQPAGMAFDTQGTLYVLDSPGSVKRVTSHGVVTTFATGLKQPLFITIQPEPSDVAFKIPEHAQGYMDPSGVSFTLTGIMNQFYEVSYSTNLTSWLAFRTNQIKATNSISILDPDAVNEPNRFYRARQLP